VLHRGSLGVNCPTGGSSNGWASPQMLARYGTNTSSPAPASPTTAS